MASSSKAGPWYGARNVRALEASINETPGRRLIIATTRNAADKALAQAILNEAERRTRQATNAVTARNRVNGEMIVVFRSRRVKRAEVLEELRHLDQPALGLWDLQVSGFTAFQMRELDVAAHFRNLLAEGAITQEEYDETIVNLSVHLGTSVHDALRILKELS